MPQQGQALSTNIALPCTQLPLSPAMTIALIYVLVTLLLQIAQSVNGLPLHARGRGMVCGVDMRPRDLRELCAGADSIWHFDVDRAFKKIKVAGLDKEKYLPEVQCGRHA